MKLKTGKKVIHIPDDVTLGLAFMCSHYTGMAARRIQVPSCGLTHEEFLLGYKAAKKFLKITKGL